jgi:2-alkyl-3-oxoalkanoate reductase
MKIYLAGATGAIGRRLVRLLIGSGHEVVAATRSPQKAEELRLRGAEPVVVGGLDEKAVLDAVARAEPEVVIHEMTALTGATSLRRFDRVFAATNELRTKGTDYLIRAARLGGARRVIAQSFAGWPNVRAGTWVKTEDDPLDPNPPAAMRQSLEAIRYLERAVTHAEGLEGIVLRYGALYGPGTGFAEDGEFGAMVRRRRVPIVGDGRGVWSFIHVDDAASATIAAIDRGAPGIYNIVDDEPAPVADWLPEFAAAVGAKPPRRVPVWLGRIASGEVGVSMMTRIRGSENGKAKRELGWQPAYPSWRAGFGGGTGDPGRLAAPQARIGQLIKRRTA